MSITARIERFLKHDLWIMDIASLHGLQRVGVQVLRLVWAAAMEFSNRLLDARAAGLVYTTLLSFVPFLAVTFSVLKAFDVHHSIEPVLAQALEPLGQKGEEITAQVIEFVSHIKVGVLGVVGIAGLLYTTYSLIDKIETTLNAIWRVQRGRSLTRKFTDYLSVVLVGPVLVVTALGLLASVQSNTVVQRIIRVQPFGYLIVSAAHLMPFVLLSGLFAFLYKFVPNTTVRFRSALVGGATAAILWVLAGEAFAAFVRTVLQLQRDLFRLCDSRPIFTVALYRMGHYSRRRSGRIFHQNPTAYRTQFLLANNSYAFPRTVGVGPAVFRLPDVMYQGSLPLQSSELARKSTCPYLWSKSRWMRLIRHGVPLSYPGAGGH